MNPVIVTASTDMEISSLVQQLQAVPLPGVGHLPAYRAVTTGGEVILAVTGVGKVNAACAATLLAERFAPRLLINTGCGGACAASGLSVGDLAIASSECFPEEGVETPQGWRGLELIGIPVFEGRGLRIFNELPLDPLLAEEALTLARRQGFQAAVGPFHTVSTCSGTSLRGEELLRRYPGICENMEGAALAQVALIHDIAFLEVRGISNLVEDRELSGWDLRRAVSEAQRFVFCYLKLSCFASSNS